MPLIVCDVVDCVDADDAEHLRAFMEKTFRTTFEAMRDGRDERVVAFRRLLDPARATLKAQPFLCGAAPAYADYILFSVFQWARIVSVFELLEPDDPLRSWRERVLDLFDGLARSARSRAPSCS